MFSGYLVFFYFCLLLLFFEVIENSKNLFKGKIKFSDYEFDILISVNVVG